MCRTGACPRRPSRAMRPQQASAHFNKLECFCFNQYTLEPGERKSWPVVFVIDPKLSKDVKTITLSYTFFEVGGKTPSAPVADATAEHGNTIGSWRMSEPVRAKRLPGIFLAQHQDGGLVIFWNSKKQRIAGRHGSRQPISHHCGGYCGCRHFCGWFDSAGELGGRQIRRPVRARK